MFFDKGTIVTAHNSGELISKEERQKQDKNYNETKEGSFIFDFEYRGSNYM